MRSTDELRNGKADMASEIGRMHQVLEVFCGNARAVPQIPFAPATNTAFLEPPNAVAFCLRSVSGT